MRIYSYDKRRNYTSGRTHFLTVLELKRNIFGTRNDGVFVVIIIKNNKTLSYIIIAAIMRTTACIVGVTNAKICSEKKTRAPCLIMVIINKRTVVPTYELIQHFSPFKI